jgi:hypothetical protein
VGDFTADFPDWDNPEDYDEGEPEGYYDDDEYVDEDEEEEGEWYVPTEDDPDYDLSEVHGYSDWEGPRRQTPFPQWAVVLAAVVLIAAILLPVILRIS